MRELQAPALSEMPTRSVSAFESLHETFFLIISSPKRDKYPEGYPGDTLEGSPTGERVKVPKRTKVLWNCEKCATTFKDREKTCANCGHEKCDSCPRTSPAKTQKPEEEAAIQSVEQRMRNLDVSPQASAA